MNSKLSIGELAAHFGVSLRTIRFYEAKGLLQPSRTNSRREFTSADFSRLSSILNAKKLGFTLLEIKALLSNTGKSGDISLPSEMIKSQMAFLIEQRRGLDASIARLKRMLK